MKINNLYIYILFLFIYLFIYLSRGAYGVYNSKDSQAYIWGGYWLVNYFHFYYNYYYHSNDHPLLILFDCIYIYIYRDSSIGSNNASYSNSILVMNPLVI